MALARPRHASAGQAAPPRMGPPAQWACAGGGLPRVSCGVARQGGGRPAPSRRRPCHATLRHVRGRWRGGARAGRHKRLSATGFPSDSHISVPRRPRIRTPGMNRSDPSVTDSGNFHFADVPVVSMHWSATKVIIAAMSAASGPLRGPTVQQPLAISRFFQRGAQTSVSSEKPRAWQPVPTHRPCSHTGAGGRGTRRTYRLAHPPLDRGCQTGPSPFHCLLNCSLSPLLPSIPASTKLASPHFLPLPHPGVSAFPLPCATAQHVFY